MIVTANMVGFLLEQEGCQFETRGNAAVEVTHVRLLRTKPLAENTLYIAAATPSRLPKTSKNTCILIASDGDPVDLLERAYDIVNRLNRWDGELKDALARGVSLSDFLLLGEHVIPYPYALFDSNVMTLGMSKSYRGELSPDLLVNLFEDDEYLQAAFRQEPFYFEADPRGKRMRSYCLNVHDEGKYVARLVVSLPDGLETLNPGARELIEHFFKAVETALHRFTGSQESLASQDDSLHALFRSALFDQKAPTPKAAGETLAAYGWGRRERYQMVKLVFFEAVNWETAALFICKQLEAQWPRSCAVYEGRCIAWTVVGIPPESTRAPFMDTVVELSRTYACKAGISDAFDDYAELGTCYREAETALAIGQVRDPHHWYYLFGNYALDYLIDACTGDFEPKHVISKKLRVLRDLDASQGTAYVETLRCFLANKQNATHTAKALFMHRTSLIRRLERMEHLAGIDFDNPDEVLYLELSLKLLGLA